MVSAVLVPILLTVLHFAESNFRLDANKSTKLAQFLLAKNLTLQFDIIQRNQTEAELFGLALGDHSIFRVSTSTVENQIGLEFRLNDGRYKLFRVQWPFLLSDGQFHKILVVFNGQALTVVENCRRLLLVENAGLDFGDHPLTELNVSLGSAELVMREFSSDTAVQLERRCPRLETMIDNRVEVEYRGGAEVDEFLRNEVEETTAKGPIAQSGWTNLERRISSLEHMILGFEGRVRRVELHQRGCKANGRWMSPGERQQNAEQCRECQCGGDGELHCGPIGCPPLVCAHPVHVPGKCCPECGSNCLYNGQIHRSGESFWPKNCVHCLCNNGRMSCEFRQPTQCPVLDCAERETPPNQCCPVCVNVDHCARGHNPCDENAVCESGRHSAVCKCKQGFFGNGTKCYDVDECRWDEYAQQQLGGCGEGTICINLPGSFKCDCVPGYRKLDAKHCLDVIRI